MAKARKSNNARSLDREAAVYAGRCKFCMGPMKKLVAANPYCRRKACLDMRLRHAKEQVDLSQGRIVANKHVRGYIIPIRAGGMRDDKPR